MSWVTMIAVLSPLETNLLQKIDDDIGRLGVERRGWLVGEDQARGVDQSPGDRDSLTLPAGELVGLEPDLRGEVQPGQQGDGFLVNLLIARPRLAVPAVQLLRQADVLDRVERAEQVVSLENETDLAAEAAEVVVVHPGQLVTEHLDGAAVRLELAKAADQGQERRLPRARLARHDDDLTGVEVEGVLAEDLFEGSTGSKLCETSRTLTSGLTPDKAFVLADCSAAPIIASIVIERCDLGLMWPESLQILLANSSGASGVADSASQSTPILPDSGRRVPYGNSPTISATVQTPIFGRTAKQLSTVVHTSDVAGSPEGRRSCLQ